MLGPDGASERLLETMLATGRLHLASPMGPRLSAGPELDAEARWRDVGGGRQQLAFTGTAGETIGQVLALRRPHYIDAATGHVGALRTALPPALASEVARAPVIAASEAAAVKELLRQRARSSPAGLDCPRRRRLPPAVARSARRGRDPPHQPGAAHRADDGRRPAQANPYLVRP